jgi:2-polyprenyl-6-hydroxyphenyl methylase/3-demethylubiquinone-9 3-methyltransferase
MELTTRDLHEREVARGDRFEFGKNWQQFLRLLDPTRIRQAEESLASMLRQPSLSGKTFLDIGSGSGLFSLAARRLGARVHSFDFDSHSVACAEELRRRFFPNDPDWTIQQGSVLDNQFVRSLGTFDIVYSWGVLHHTGRMWDAVDAACAAVAPGGKLFIALYNDLGTRTSRWRVIKRAYNRVPAAVRPLFTAIAIAPEELKNMARSIVTGHAGDYIRSWTAYNGRGMNHWRDAVDWVGGYPYEVATPEAVLDFCRARGFELTAMRCGGVGLGCNEFVFDRKPV